MSLQLAILIYFILVYILDMLVVVVKQIVIYFVTFNFIITLAVTNSEEAIENGGSFSWFFQVKFRFL